MSLSLLLCYYRSTQTSRVIHREKNDERGKRWNKQDDYLTLYILYIFRFCLVS